MIIENAIAEIGTSMNLKRHNISGGTCANHKTAILTNQARFLVKTARDQLRITTTCAFIMLITCSGVLNLNDFIFPKYCVLMISKHQNI